MRVPKKGKETKPALSGGDFTMSILHFSHSEKNSSFEPFQQIVYFLLFPNFITKRMYSIGFCSSSLSQKSNHFPNVFRDVRRRLQLSINSPLLDSKESKGKCVNQKAWDPQTTNKFMLSSFYQHESIVFWSPLKIQYSILFASACIESLFVYTSHAEVVLRVLLKL